MHASVALQVSWHAVLLILCYSPKFVEVSRSGVHFVNKSYQFAPMATQT